MRFYFCEVICYLGIIRVYWSKMYKYDWNLNGIRAYLVFLARKKYSGQYFFLLSFSTLLWKWLTDWNIRGNLITIATILCVAVFRFSISPPVTLLRENVSSETFWVIILLFKRFTHNNDTSREFVIDIHAYQYSIFSVHTIPQVLYRYIKHRRKCNSTFHFKTKRAAIGNNVYIYRHFTCIVYGLSYSRRSIKWHQYWRFCKITLRLI